MLSRAVRVPRICVACRFGLITQRSAVLGFRASTIREGLGQRRRYTSDEAKLGDTRVEAFISNRNNVSETKSSGEPKEDESIGTATESKDTTTTDNTSANETATEPTQIPEELQSDGLDNNTDSFSELNTASAAEPPSLFELPELPELEENDIPKRQFRHDLMHDESLGVSALGAPADAIIINNPNKLRRKKKPPTVIEAQPIKPPTDIDWKHLHPGKDGLEPDAKEIYANINELRPDTRVLRLSEIDKLIETLRSGFTLKQLRDYYSDFPHEETNEPEMASYSWVGHQIDWVPINEVRIGGAEKSKHAQRIVLDKWKIEAQETVDNLGRASVYIDPHIFPLLTYGPNNTGRLITELRRDFLVGEDESISMDRAKKRIHITARKSTTFGILAHLDQAIQTMQTRDIDVEFYTQSAASVFKRDELIELGRLTMTSIRSIRVGEQTKLKVSWIPEPEEPVGETSPLEDRADIVRRLIKGRVPPLTFGHLECIPPEEDDMVSGHFVQVNRQNRGMAWRDKLQKWHRLVRPLSKSSEHQKPLDLKSSTDFPELKKTPDRHQDVVTATFGHVLHREACDTTKKLYRRRPILVPLTPHPASFSALRFDLYKPLIRSTTIILYLEPSWDSAETKLIIEKGVPNRPSVRIRLPISSDANLSNFSIPEDASADCCVRMHNTPVMRPTESVDVHLKHERFLGLNMDQPGLAEFLETSEFNLLEGRLRTPSQAKIRVPEVWTGDGRKYRKLTETPYDFRGLEIHQTIDVPWQGHTLRYSSIEAGQHGQRQEITLQAGTPKQVQVGFQKKQRASFLDLVDEVAAGKHFSWTEGHKAIKNRQLEDYSYNLPEEELTEDIIVDMYKFDKRGRPNPERYEQDDFLSDDEYVSQRRSSSRNRHEQEAAPSEDRYAHQHRPRDRYEHAGPSEDGSISRRRHSIGLSKGEKQDKVLQSLDYVLQGKPMTKEEMSAGLRDEESASAQEINEEEYLIAIGEKRPAKAGPRTRPQAVRDADRLLGERLLAEQAAFMKAYPNNAKPVHMHGSWRDIESLDDGPQGPAKNAKASFPRASKAKTMPKANNKSTPPRKTSSPSANFDDIFAEKFSLRKTDTPVPKKNNKSMPSPNTSASSASFDDVFAQKFALRKSDGPLKGSSGKKKSTRRRRKK
ncbi:hypothetical protein F66182_10544 [Fusarium sp. NRRL 66182]|nr:hypothetical protein F66182_10544 [Fusarium sp. NRRL 66182]